MTSSIEARLTRRAVAADVRVSDSRLTAVLIDDREVSVPLSEFPELAAATPQQRANWEITALGTAIYWPDIDEEFGLAGMLGVSETAIEEAAGFTIHNREPLGLGMSSPTERVSIQPALASAVRVSTDRLSVDLTDGRQISVPIERFPRLAEATPAERKNWEITAFGTAIRWPDIDEDIGVATLLGVPESLVEEAAGFEIHDLR